MKVEQQGLDPEHYVAKPTAPTTLAEYQAALDSVPVELYLPGEEKRP